MELINTAYGEKLLNALVGTLHSLCVLRIIGRFMLIYKNAVFGKRIAAIAVKFACEKTFSGTEGVCAVNDDKIVAVFLCADVFKTVLNMNVYSGVVQLASR